MILSHERTIYWGGGGQNHDSSFLTPLSENTVNCEHIEERVRPAPKAQQCLPLFGDQLAAPLTIKIQMKIALFVLIFLHIVRAPVGLQVLIQLPL